MRRSRLLILPLAAVALAGCGTHLYRANDHKLAETAETNFRDAALSESLEGERGVLERLLQQELEMVRRQTTARRDAAIRAIVGNTDSAGSWGELDRRTRARFQELVGSDQAAAKLIDAVVSLDVYAQALEQSTDLYRLAKGPEDPQPACPMRAPRKEPPPEVLVALRNHENICKQYLDAQSSIRDFAAPGTTLGEANAALEQTDLAYADLKASIDSLNAAYRAAQEAHHAAVEQKDQSEIRRTAAALKEHLARLDAPLERAKSIDGDFEDLKLAGLVAKLDKERQSIGQVLDALSAVEAGEQAEPLPATQTALSVISLLPELEGQVSSTRYPPVGPLLLEAENLRLRLEAARRRVANAEARLLLMRLKRDALLEELIWVNKTLASLRQLATVGGASCVVRSSLMDDFVKNKGACRELIVNALLHFANSWTLGRIPQEEIDYRLIAARHTAVLDASEVALAQWQSLIGVPISQLAVFHGSGVKPEDFSALFSTLGFGAASAAALK